MTPAEEYDSSAEAATACTSGAEPGPGGEAPFAKDDTSIGAALLTASRYEPPVGDPLLPMGLAPNGEYDFLAGGAAACPPPGAEPGPGGEAPSAEAPFVEDEVSIGAALLTASRYEPPVGDPLLPIGLAPNGEYDFLAGGAAA